MSVPARSRITIAGMGPATAQRSNRAQAAYLAIATSLCCCSYWPQLEPLPHLHAAPVAGDDGGQCVAVLQGALIAVMAVMQSPHTDHVTPAVTGLTEVHSNLQGGPAANRAC